MTTCVFLVATFYTTHRISHGGQHRQLFIALIANERTVSLLLLLQLLQLMLAQSRIVESYLWELRLRSFVDAVILKL